MFLCCTSYMFSSVFKLCFDSPKGTTWLPLILISSYAISLLSMGLQPHELAVLTDLLCQIALQERPSPFLSPLRHITVSLISPVSTQIECDQYIKF